MARAQAARGQVAAHQGWRSPPPHSQRLQDVVVRALQRTVWAWHTESSRAGLYRPPKQPHRGQRWLAGPTDPAQRLTHRDERKNDTTITKATTANKNLRAHSLRPAPSPHWFPEGALSVGGCPLGSRQGLDLRCPFLCGHWPPFPLSLSPRAMCTKEGLPGATSLSEGGRGPRGGEDSGHGT